MASVLSSNGLINNSEENFTKFGAFTKGHQRRGSEIEFQELTHRDAKQAMAKELYKLMNTVPTGTKETVEKELDGFQRLFDRFMVETGPSVEWEDIKLLPQEAVSTENVYKNPSKEPGCKLWY
ncbi:UTP--glucose-1-phosphate uridylyltransferase-like isoform X2 [Lingula anatina]|uniref:UTP--glucose-1-phosphate uridylyltransferase-like isoform X2 n=1 Tax=Lingula anatina TaxID=7574 RepID=A0A1S3JF68_LINAN|nr:UTP--glucose-1-phosphate uridylyltransferase-like isoform X2 [Lingula anatina]|eukprot:XP_013409057.1 UTP--glucose-1-phosphate uridylyltransferase-like isoform X2 [Lingula anatina]